MLRPVAFMEGYYSEPVKIGILQGKLVQPVHGDKPYQTIATDDIGGFVAAAFERPKDFLGLELEIAGSELTNLEAAEVFSRVLGRPVEFVEMPIPPDKEYSQMFNWFNDAGFQADIGALRHRYPERRLQTLEQWLYNEGWHKARAAYRAAKRLKGIARMQDTAIHDGRFVKILWDGDSHIIGIDWKDTTAAMTDEDFKADLTLFAGHVEEKQARGILVDVARFRHQPGPGMQEWRVKNISPRYYAAGVRRFAFLFPEGAQIPPI